MELSTAYDSQTDKIIELFTSTFTNSESPAEGELVGKLVADMFETVDAADMFVFLALDGDMIAGAIIFSRLSYPQEARTVFILAPVAVATSHQRKGLGQELLTYGLTHLREKGVDVALTYGDINFYSKVGFVQITEKIAQPPLPLAYPEGWLGQSLTVAPLIRLEGPSHCVEALNSPDYW